MDVRRIESKQVTYAVSLRPIDDFRKGIRTTMYEKRLVKNDFGWAAKNRDRILAEWSKRYESKAAPK